MILKVGYPFEGLDDELDILPQGKKGKSNGSY